MDYGTYVSCIKIAKQPIIPPLLSEECRNEMRYYRDLAASLEKRRKWRRNSADSGVMISSNDGSCRRKANAAETVASEPAPAADTMVSADGSSSNETMVSAEGSAGDSDHDNVFFEAQKSCSSAAERRNSYTIERNADHETRTQAVCDLQTETATTASQSFSTADERRNSFTESPSASKGCEIFVQSERRNSYTIEDSSGAAPVNTDVVARRNSYTVQDPHISGSESPRIPVPGGNSLDPAVTPVATERRNSYTLESPSPVMLQYIQSLEHHDPNKQCELFVESLHNHVADTFEKQLENGFEEPELSLDDLVSIECDLKSSELMWDACSDETLHNFLKADLESLPSSVCGSPVSVVPAGNLSARLKNASDVSDTKPAAVRSGECICDAISDFEPLISEVADSISPKNHFDDRVNDSFSRDFRYLDASAFSCDSDCAEGRYSECSSVSLSKFLSGDKLEGAEAEYAAFAYMKEQLQQKHRDQFKRLLREQQREHDHLKAQFAKVSSLSKRTPSPGGSYAYSGSVLLKKYTPTSGQSTPPRCRSVDEPPKNGTCGRSDGFDGSSNGVEVTRTSMPNGKPPRPSLTVEQAASKINAAIRGYLTRRLFKTERVTHLVQTIRDCLATALSLQSESNLGLSELDLQSRLLQQLTVACNDLHSTFSLPVTEKMAVIAADREKKFRLSLKRRTPLPLSEATRRTLQRRNLAYSAPPAQRKYDRRRCKSASSTTSETNSCRSTPGSRRLVNTILPQNADSLGGRPPWR